MHLVIVGGVAGGSSCAGRYRRLDEEADITIIERGRHVSFASCGLPYFVGDVIHSDKNLLVTTPEVFLQQYRIKVHLQSEATEIDRQNKTCSFKNLETGQVSVLSYDKLVLATGGVPIRPNLPGMHLPGVFTLKTIPDALKLREFAEKHGARRAVIVGAGFIGMEVAENLKGLGLDVSIVELSAQVLPPVDAEMAQIVYQHVQERGQVPVHLQQGLQSIEEAAIDPNNPKNGSSGDCRLLLHTKSCLPTVDDLQLPCDLVLIAMGVRPENSLAVAAGLAVGKRGGIVVNDCMQTSDPDIYGCGDVVETKNAISGGRLQIPLAGPANRQGRVVADSIAGRQSSYRGSQGTAICQIFGLSVGLTGVSEKDLQRGLGPSCSFTAANVQVARVTAGAHVDYFPGGTVLRLKVYFDGKSGLVLGAQAVGEHGVSKRIDIISTYIQLKGTMHDMAEAELSYAPQFGAAKDLVNMVGMIGENATNGLVKLIEWCEAKNRAREGKGIIVDVRQCWELEKWRVTDVEERCIWNIPIEELRNRVAELPEDKEVYCFCRVGQRGYNAARIIAQVSKAPVYTISGGIDAHACCFPEASQGCYYNL
jgi:NADPH-dependent 2,4-dienoyl-CoA reductase/sulfur reductase-like enzyme/rhodanese-related sulfurtransferase